VAPMREEPGRSLLKAHGVSVKRRALRYGMTATSAACPCLSCDVLHPVNVHRSHDRDGPPSASGVVSPGHDSFSLPHP
jgi:hypothetical protein